MSDALALIPPLVIAAVLALSALAKVRSPQPARDAFVSLRLPRWLARSAAPVLLPWGELLLALAVLVLPGVSGTVATVAALLLMLVYLVLIVRALGFDEKVTCGCFGELGLGDVTGRTAVRNALLVVAGALTVWASLVDDRAPLWRWVQAGAEGWAWGAMVLLVGALVWLIVGGGAQTTALAEAPAASEEDVEELDYLRAPTPFAMVTRADGTTTTLRDAARTQAQLLVFVSLTCGSCERVIARMGEWQRQLDGIVAVRAVFRATGPDALPEADESLTEVIQQAYYDRDATIARTLGITGTPAAVLFGTDDLLAGGPVAGETDVTQLVEDVIEQVHGSVEVAETEA